MTNEELAKYLYDEISRASGGHDIGIFPEVVRGDTIMASTHLWNEGEARFDTEVVFTLTVNIRITNKIER